MLNSLQKSPEQLGALAQVREWTRARFDLPEDAAILVSEIACGLPGCPDWPGALVATPLSQSARSKMWR